MQEHLPRPEIALVEHLTDVLVHGRDGGAGQRRAQVRRRRRRWTSTGVVISVRTSADAHAGGEAVEDVLGQEWGVGHEPVELGAVDDGQRELHERLGDPEPAQIVGRDAGEQGDGRRGRLRRWGRCC